MAKAPGNALHNCAVRGSIVRAPSDSCAHNLLTIERERAKEKEKESERESCRRRRKSAADLSADLSLDFHRSFAGSRSQRSATKEIDAKSKRRPETKRRLEVYFGL